jgi:electron transport complex protein RnfC
VPGALHPHFGSVRFKPVGAHVAAGEALVESARGYEHTPVAPVPGHIVETGLAILTNLSEVPSVLFEPDAEVEAPMEDVEPVSTEAVADMLPGLGPGHLVACLDRLRGAGVWADRWTSPDLLGQLHACLRSPADIVLCSLLDADRALGINLACAEEYPTEIVAAVAALARLIGAGRAWFAVDAEQDPQAWAGLRQVAAQVAGDLRFVPVDNDYPQPDPTLLLQSLTGRRLRPGRMPTDQGVLLLDAAAALAVGRALVRGEPMLHVPLAIHDRPALPFDAEPADATHLVMAAVGTPLGDVLDLLGVGHLSTRRGLDFWAGAPLRERRLTPSCVIAGGELGIFVAPRDPSINPDPCIRCGWCVEGCPVDAHPAALLDDAQSADLRRADAHGLTACIECGICSYVCPSHLPLLQGIRSLRRTT